MMKVKTKLAEALTEFELPPLTGGQELENRVRDIFRIHQGKMSEQDVQWQLKTKAMKAVLAELVKDKIVVKRGSNYVWPDMAHSLK